MGVTIGTVDREQVMVFLATMGRAFGFDTDNEERAENFAEIFEWPRSRAAFDGDQMVGTTGAFSLDLTVPGARMACGGTTVVSVLPTHRRQGILRSMMDAHLLDVRERGEPIAGLWAADSAIYGRFGYGCAAQAVDLEISRNHSKFHRLAPAPAPVRLIASDEASEMLPPFYDDIRRTVPGFYARSSTWWRTRILRDSPDRRGGASAYRYAVAESDGKVIGYVQYRFKEKWDHGHGEGELLIDELFGTDPESWSGLWRFALDHDLMARVKASQRSVEDPILELLEGRRRAAQTLADSLWIRVMDVKTALEGRSYSQPVNVVISLHDPLDATTSSWRLDLGPDGAEVTPSDADPDVVMDLEDLGACFMGWSRFSAMARTGRITGEPDRLNALDGAFTWRPVPWCPEVF